MEVREGQSRDEDSQHVGGSSCTSHSMALGAQNTRVECLLSHIPDARAGVKISGSYIQFPHYAT